MRDQLDHLAKVSSDRISVHIVRSADHDGVDGSFVLTTLDDRSEVAYVDTVARGLILGDASDLTAFGDPLNEIRSGRHAR